MRQNNAFRNNNFGFNISFSNIVTVKTWSYKKIELFGSQTPTGAALVPYQMHCHSAAGKTECPSTDLVSLNIEINSVVTETLTFPGPKLTNNISKWEDKKTVMLCCQVREILFETDDRALSRRELNHKVW